MPPNSNRRTSAVSRPEPPAEDHFNDLVDRIKSATNVLVTVSKNPSVDQLAASIGLTIALNKLGKHATCVFSGKVPSTLEFLQPEKTIETNTNSLRDFIISLDKSKADKLRYKVEDEFVKIFITPYRTSISDKDFAFSQGDFNVDLIITLGVRERNDLDGAIVAHGRILHDATVASLNTSTEKHKNEIGTINIVNSQASSLSEIAADLVAKLDRKLFDTQIATALLTGLVAETDRFGNDKARPHTMEVASVLMASGASPQLISNELKEPEEPAEEIPPVVESDDDTAEGAEQPENDDGTINIDHNAQSTAEQSLLDEQTPSDEQPPPDDINIDDDGTLKPIDNHAAEESATERDDKEASAPRQPGQKALVLDPPQLSGRLTANTVAEDQQLAPAIDALGQKEPTSPILSRNKSPATPEPPVPPLVTSQQTLAEIEQAVNSVHLEDYNRPPQEPTQTDSVPPPPPVDDARAAVEEAATTNEEYRPEPISALGATPVDLDLGHQDVATEAAAQEPTEAPSATPDEFQPTAPEIQAASTADEPSADASQETPQSPSPDSPPPVPPPFTPGV